jgi:hypothetical protein
MKIEMKNGNKGMDGALRRLCTKNPFRSRIAFCSRSVLFRFHPPLASIPPLPEGEGWGEGEGNELSPNAELYNFIVELRFIAQSPLRHQVLPKFANRMASHVPKFPAPSPLTTDHGRLATVKTGNTQHSIRNFHPVSPCCSKTTVCRTQTDTDGHTTPS